MFVDRRIRCATNKVDIWAVGVLALVLYDNSYDSYLYENNRVLYTGCSFVSRCRRT